MGIRVSVSSKVVPVASRERSEEWPQNLWREVLEAHGGRNALSKAQSLQLRGRISFPQSPENGDIAFDEALSAIDEVSTPERGMQTLLNWLEAGGPASNLPLPKPALRLLLREPTRTLRLETPGPEAATPKEHATMLLMELTRPAGLQLLRAEINEDSSLGGLQYVVTLDGRPMEFQESFSELRSFGPLRLPSHKVIQCAGVVLCRLNFESIEVSAAERP